MFKPGGKRTEKPEIRVLALDECLAKTIRVGSEHKRGANVETHSLIVGLVARELLSRMPPLLKESIFSDGSELVAAAHDVGKVSPGFQEKIHRDIGAALGLVSPDLDKAIGYHFAVSQASVRNLSKYIPEILGRHHGYNSQNINLPDSEIYGGTGWQQARLSLLDALKEQLGVDWPAIPSALHSDVLAGLTSVADWIGSGSAFDDVRDWREIDGDSLTDKVSSAVDQAGFVTPKLRNGLQFKNVFDVAPYRIQSQFFDSVRGPGTYVLEAPMGSGKTEAALYAAYRTVASGRATGVYFALPTQLTSDRIYDRMNSFLERVLVEDDPHRRPLLLHGSAWLRDTELGAEGAPGQSWFNSSKRGLLAPFAVGTIDQALMAVMNVKHGFVRAFGLAGKVVILDEVHSYDSFTGTILKELVGALRRLNCTVIILSATLTDQHRRSILGLNVSHGAPEESVTPYPLVTSAPMDGDCQENEVAWEQLSQVSVCMVQEDSLATDEALSRAGRGEQVLWIENTVDDAQQRYRYLAAKAAELGLEFGLLHSRFLRTDRQINEDKWVKLYGKSGRKEAHRTGRILIGTQVLEQSLDIDADFLVTRLCPTDMLFQRLGRLWRHRESDDLRVAGARREAWVLSPSLTDAYANQGALGKSAVVYSPYVLYRTLEVWQDVSLVVLPQDIRRLLEATYCQRHEAGVLAKAKSDMEGVRDRLSRLALHGVSRGGVTQPESKATTRHSEVESVDVLLLRKQMHTDRGVVIRLMDNSEMLLPRSPAPAERRRIASVLLANTVTVPAYLAPAIVTKQIEWLRDYVYLGDQKESPFRAAIGLGSDELQGIGGYVANEKYELSYDSSLGYSAKKRGE